MQSTKYICYNLVMSWNAIKYVQVNILYSYFDKIKCLQLL